MVNQFRDFEFGDLKQKRKICDDHFIDYLNSPEKIKNMKTMHKKDFNYYHQLRRPITPPIEQATFSEFNNYDNQMDDGRSPAMMIIDEDLQNMSIRLQRPAKRIRTCFTETNINNKTKTIHTQIYHTEAMPEFMCDNTNLPPPPLTPRNSQNIRPWWESKPKASHVPVPPCFEVCQEDNPNTAASNVSSLDSPIFYQQKNSLLTYFKPNYNHNNKNKNTSKCIVDMVTSSESVEKNNPKPNDYSYDINHPMSFQKKQVSLFHFFAKDNQDGISDPLNCDNFDAHIPRTIEIDDMIID